MSGVFLGKCKNYNSKKLYNVIKQGFNSLGGIDFVRGKKILLNPNLLAPVSPEKGVTTHPEVIRAVGRLIQQNGGEVFIGDSPGMGTLKTLYKITGIKKIADEEDFEIPDFKNSMMIKNPDGVLVKKFEIAKAYEQVDYIFSLAKLKTHGMTYYTGAAKNLFGMIPGLLKPPFHYKFSKKQNFADMLIDLNFLLKPKLSIIDGIMAMEGDGPRNGNLRNLKAIIISKDSIAADTVACKLVNINPKKIVTNIAGAKRGLGTMDLNNINIYGRKIKDLEIKNFKHPPREVNLDNLIPVPGFLKKIIEYFLVPKPKFYHDKCILCKECVKVCPSKPKSLSVKNNKIEINRKSCIKCFCCQEMCPVGAIEPKKFILN